MKKHVHKFKVVAVDEDKMIITRRCKCGVEKQIKPQFVCEVPGAAE